MVQRSLVALGALVISLLVASVAPGGQPQYMRVVEDEHAVRLDVAIRTFAPLAGHGPKVHLVGVSHVADAAYYGELQKFLDAQDLVLFEGVKPEADGALEASADDSSRIRITHQRVRSVGLMVARFQRAHKRLPESLDEALAELKGPTARLARSATKDAWGTALRYLPTPAVGGDMTQFDVVSYGSDGKAGGDGPGRDIALATMEPITKEELAADEGVQIRLARALGMEFQLAAINYDRANWRNSDITVDALRRRMGEEGGNIDALLGMLSGTSLSGKLVGVLLSFIEANATLAAQTKLMLVEMLGHGDELMAAQSRSLRGLGGENLFKVLIEERNQVALADLRRAVEENPALGGVAVFYGAGHLASMERDLLEQGYAAEGEQWRTAVRVDLDTYPGGAKAARAARQMMSRMIDAQSKRSK